MSDSHESQGGKIRSIICLVASVIIGVTLIAAGSGKIIGFGEVPGQTVEFIGDVLPAAFINSTTIFLIYEVFIPFVLPLVEIIFGVLLLAGFMPRLIAILCIPLTLAFMSNNIWAISQGLDKFPECVCFGIWENIFGGLTPLQSLGYDIGLLILAIVIIILLPGRFLASREYLERHIRKKTIYDL